MAAQVTGARNVSPTGHLGDDGVRPAPRRSGEALLAILGNVSSVTMGCEDDGQHAQHLRFVFDDENQLLRWRLTRRGHTTSLASLT